MAIMCEDIKKCFRHMISSKIECEKFPEFLVDKQKRKVKKKAYKSEHVILTSPIYLNIVPLASIAILSDT